MLGFACIIMRWSGSLAKLVGQVDEKDDKRTQLLTKLVLKDQPINLIEAFP